MIFILETGKTVGNIKLISTKDYYQTTSNFLKITFKTVFNILNILFIDGFGY